MEIEATPALTESELEAVRVGLARLNIDLSTKLSMSAWRTAATREAIDSEPSRPRYARSPRRTRGATRA